MKRFQECNWLEKVWRYRHYMYIPFKWFYYQYISAFYITDDETFIDEKVRGKVLFKLLKSIAQLDMKWYHTMEEVRKSFGMDDYEDDSDETEYWKGND